MADTLRSKASEHYTKARKKATQALTEGRRKASEALDIGANRVRGSAKDAKQQTVRGVDAHPLAAIAGGLAIGALLASLLPRTAREDKYIGPVSRTVKSTAKSAAKVAGTVAKAEMIALGVNSGTARQQVRDLAGKIGKAATSARTAAVKTLRKDSE
jgi:ElaB/YqjD/DUF883 family membrane-anchored ribosome-binding protein